MPELSDLASLRAASGGSSRSYLAFGGNDTRGPIDVATACNAHGGPHGRLDFESETFIADALRAEGFDASEDGTGRGTPLVPVAFAHQGGGTQTRLGYDPDSGTCQTLGSNQTPAIAFSSKDHGADAGDLAPTLRAMGHSKSHPNSGGQVATTTRSGVRRLTPRECERLQGFSEVRKSCIILVCSSESLRAAVLAEIQNPRSPTSVSLAAASASMLSAENAEPPSSISLLGRDRPVAAHALIDLEREAVQIRRAGKCLWSASGAGEQNSPPLHMPTGSFARLGALLTRAWEPATPDGRAGSHPSIGGSILLPNGSAFALASGPESEALASDAGKLTNEASRCITSTTLQAGRGSQPSDSTQPTSPCCVSAAIAGFIPEPIKSADLYAITLETRAGYTLVPLLKKNGEPTGKFMADGPRYKMLGNSMATTCMSWMGRRIEMVRAMDAERSAA